MTSGIDGYDIRSIYVHSSYSEALQVPYCLRYSIAQNVFTHCSIVRKISIGSAAITRRDFLALSEAD
jgi:hypothetical protein